MLGRTMLVEKTVPQLGYRNSSIEDCLPVYGQISPDEIARGEQAQEQKYFGIVEREIMGFFVPGHVRLGSLVWLFRLGLFVPTELQMV